MAAILLLNTSRKEHIKVYTRVFLTIWEVIARQNKLFERMEQACSGKNSKVIICNIKE
jgi:hypothetical protein